MNKKVIVIALLISMIFRFSFVISHFDHECTHDDNCSICLLINQFKKDINTFVPNLSNIIINIFINVIAIFIALEFFIINRILDKKRNTPIGLKVELIN